MKKLLALLLVLCMSLGCAAFAFADEGTQFDPELVAAAKAEGELVVYGSCEEEYLSAVCDRFQALFGIKVTHQRLSTGEVQAKIEEEAGNPSADVWFGGTTDPYNVCAAEDLLLPYEATNAVHLLGKLSDEETAKTILRACEDIDQIESNADREMRAAMSQLFRQKGLDVRELIKHKAIYEMLETVTDKCEDVANHIEGIVLESS